MHNNYDNRRDTLENMRSIRCIPLDILPNGKARKFLMELASKGWDVYAYHNFDPISQTPRWMVWYYGRPRDIQKWEKAFYESEPVPPLNG